MTDSALTDAQLAFVSERHLASLTLLRADGTPHVTPIGFTYDLDRHVVRVITWSGSVKTRLLERSGGGRGAVCQVDGGRWITLEGHAVVTGDADRCAEGVRRYGQRYEPPKDRGADRRVIEITVDRVLGRR